ncbi:MAG: amidohydrolase family protein [Gemmatimonadetes bacterium]|nr:amidohydrolase family protein [Gemmatimonadota bacterium]
MSSVPLAGPEPLIDVHAHFHWAGTGRADWQHINARRLEAGDRIGIRVHVASILGTWGHRSPTYFASRADVRDGNDAMFALAAADATRVRAYVHVNPNDEAHAHAEVRRGIAAGAIGIKVAAARRCDDPLLDPIAVLAAEHHLPILHHLWQHRTRHWPGQDISDAADYARLAARHPHATFIAAHIGGGGDWQHSLAAVRDVPNICFDLSGSGVDRGMLERCVEMLGAERLLWAADLTLDTGLAKLRALETMRLAPADMAAIRWRNAVRIFPRGAFGALTHGAAA